MKSMLKRILSVVLVFFLCLLLLPHLAMPVEAASMGLGLSQLREKFPHGKYWNHAGKPGSSNSVNNQDGYILSATIQEYCLTPTSLPQVAGRFYVYESI